MLTTTKLILTLRSIRAIDFEEYKSEDDMHRVVNESSEDRSSCQSELEDNAAGEEVKRGRRRRAHGDVSVNYQTRAVDDKEI